MLTWIVVGIVALGGDSSRCNSFDVFRVVDKMTEIDKNEESSPAYLESTISIGIRQ